MWHICRNIFSAVLNKFDNKYFQKISKNEFFRFGILDWGILKFCNWSWIGFINLRFQTTHGKNRRIMDFISVSNLFFLFIKHLLFNLYFKTYVVCNVTVQFFNKPIYGLIFFWNLLWQLSIFLLNTTFFLNTQNYENENYNSCL